MLHPFGMLTHKSFISLCVTGCVNSPPNFRLDWMISGKGCSPCHCQTNNMKRLEIIFSNQKPCSSDGLSLLFLVSRDSKVKKIICSTIIAYMPKILSCGSNTYIFKSNISCRWLLFLMLCDNCCLLTVTNCVNSVSNRSDARLFFTYPDLMVSHLSAALFISSAPPLSLSSILLITENVIIKRRKSDYSSHIWI